MTVPMKLAKATLGILFFLTGTALPSAETGGFGAVIWGISSLLFLELRWCTTHRGFAGRAAALKYRRHPTEGAHDPQRADAAGTSTSKVFGYMNGVPQ